MVRTLFAIVILMWQEGPVEFILMFCYLWYQGSNIILFQANIILLQGLSKNLLYVHYQTNIHTYILHSTIRDGKIRSVMKLWLGHRECNDCSWWSTDKYGILMVIFNIYLVGWLTFATVNNFVS